MFPKISIIVPIYNSSKHLQKCISSILQQEYTNFEIILVDDGSTDNSSAICLKYASEDSRIKFFKQENKGAAAARNLGIEKAEGSFLGFVDSDDFIDRDMYQKMIECQQTTSADIVKISNRDIFENGSIIEKKESNNIKILNKNEEIKNTFLTPSHFSLWKCLFRTELFQNLSIPQISNFEDIAIAIPLLQKANKIVYINKALYNYRITSNSLSRKQISSLNRKLIKDEFEKIFEMYKKNHFLKKYLICILNRTLIEYIITLIKEQNYNNNKKIIRKEFLHYFPLFITTPCLYKSWLKHDLLYFISPWLYKKIIFRKHLSN